MHSGTVNYIVEEIFSNITLIQQSINLPDEDFWLIIFLGTLIYGKMNLELTKHLHVYSYNYFCYFPHLLVLTSIDILETW